MCVCWTVDTRNGAHTTLRVNIRVNRGQSMCACAFVCACACARVRLCARACVRRQEGGSDGEGQRRQTGRGGRRPQTGRRGQRQRGPGPPPGGRQAGEDPGLYIHEGFIGWPRLLPPHPLLRVIRPAQQRPRPRPSHRRRRKRRRNSGAALRRRGPCSSKAGGPD